MGNRNLGSIPGSTSILHKSCHLCVGAEGGSRGVNTLLWAKHLEQFTWEAQLKTQGLLLYVGWHLTQG